MQHLIYLFDIKGYIPHGYCLSWSPLLLWLHVISDLVITSAYYSIPLTLMYFIRKRKDFPYPRLAVMFSVFIIACGTTHLLSAITIWIPLYWIEGLLKGFTALISTATAILMLWVVPRALALPRTEQMQAEIQQRKTVEAEKQEALDKLHRITDQLPGVVFQFRVRVDGSFCIPYASDMLRDIYRIEPAEVFNDAAKLLVDVHPDDLEGLLCSIRLSARNLSPWRHEYRLSFADNTERWLFGSALPQREDGGSILWHGFVTDITERKQAADIILAAAQYSRSLIEASLDPLMTISKKGVITDVNIATEKVTGINRGNLIGTDFTDYFTEPEKALAAYNLVFANDFLIDYPLAIRHVSGKVTHVLYNASVYYDNKNNVLGVFAAARDITERREAIKKDKLHLEKLAHVTRLGLMGQMASGIAHEVNQPLAAISTYAQVSINLIKNERPDLVKLTEILVKMQEQALRAGRIIHRMKEFGKSHSQQNLVANINTLIIDATEFCVTELKHNKVTLNLELTSKSLLVFVDHIQIEQVIINLIRNSIDALQNLPPNQHRQITIKSNLTASNDIQVSVKDNGFGIDKDQQRKILTPFYTTKINGTGMGLSISRSLIEASGGALYFNSELGKGSTFYFTLPIETAERACFTVSKSLA